MNHTHELGRLRIMMCFYQFILSILATVLLITKSSATDCSISPENLIERPLEDVFLKCTCRVVDPGTYITNWCRDLTCANPLLTGQDYNIDIKYDATEVCNTLIVNSAGIDDTDTYYCKGNDSIVAQTNLKIEDVPVARILPRTASVIIGQETTLVCQLLNSLNKRLDEPVVWRKNGVDLDGDNVMDVEINGTQLIIKVGSSSDGGNYSCGQYDQSLQVEDALELNTAIKMETKTTVTVKVGKMASLNCIATGYPLASFQWQDNQPATETHDQLLSTSTSSLVFPKVTEDNEDTYQCTASNGVGEDVTTFIKLVVESAGSILTPSTWTFTMFLLLATSISRILNI